MDKFNQTLSKLDFHQMPEHPTYELVVIGAGIAGLSAALAWCIEKDTTKYPVLVLEKNTLPGGCVTTFARKGYRFDTVQIIPDISELLVYFGLDLSLVKFEPYYARLFLADTAAKTSTIFSIPSTLESFEIMMTEMFPKEKEKIRRFFRYTGAMHGELNYLKTEPRWFQLPGILYHCRKILANSNCTYSQFLKKFKFRDPLITEILDTFSSFSGLSGDRCASLLTACAMVTTLKGSFRPSKGFIQLPLALKKRIEEKGGVVRMSSRVERILVRGGKATGVELSDGEIIHAKQIISTVDSRVTFGTLLTAEKTGFRGRRYFRKARKAEMSPSGFAIHLGLDDQLDLRALGFDCGYNVLTTGQDTYSMMFDAWEGGALLRSEEIFHLAVISPSLKTGGKQNLIIHVIPAPAKKWIELRDTHYSRYRKEKEALAAFYIRKVEEYMIPSLREHVIYQDISTPATFHRYLGSPSGSLYDMMPVPSNFGKNRLPVRTPVKGLFTTRFSHGIWACMQAGLQVADILTEGTIMKGNTSYRPPE